MQFVVPAMSGRGALNEMKEVPWSTFGNAYSGAAPTVPNHVDGLPNIFRSFFSEQHEDRLDAYHEMIGLAWHQGSIYEVTAYVLPFLLALSAELDTPSRGYMLASTILMFDSATQNSRTKDSQSILSALNASRFWIERNLKLGPKEVTHAMEFVLIALDGAAVANEESLRIASELEALGHEEELAIDDFEQAEHAPVTTRSQALDALKKRLVVGVSSTGDEVCSQ